MGKNKRNLAYSDTGIRVLKYQQTIAIEKGVEREMYVIIDGSGSGVGCGHCHKRESEIGVNTLQIVFVATT